MSKPPSGLPSLATTPAPSSPPPSESIFSDLDGTAASVLDGGEVYTWDQSRVDPSSLNLVSWKLDVNAIAEDGVNRRGFNAISTVLNHPTKKANPLRSSRKPLPPLGQPPLQLPKPPPPAFYDSYLKSISPLYDTLRSTGASSIAGPSSITLDDVHAQHPSQSLPPLDNVPELFFESDFSLSNPSTWAAVVDAEDGSPAGRLEDTLSSHLDILERHLVHEITLRSSAFFSALSNLQDLHSESSSCLSRISSLQSSLQGVGSQQAQKGLDIIEEHEQLRVLRKTEAGLKQLIELEDLMRMAQVSVDAGDWAGGLGYLEDIVRWWETHGPVDASEEPGETSDKVLEGAIDSPAKSETPTLPLSTVPALSNLPSTFAQLSSSISTQLQTSLKLLLLDALSRSDSSDDFVKEAFADSIRPILLGLVRCGDSRSLEDAWNEVLTASIREGSRKHLPVLTHEDDPEAEVKPDGPASQERGANLATSLRGMDHSQFLLLSSQMFSTVLSRLHLAQIMGECMREILSESSSTRTLALKANVATEGPAAPTETGSPLDLSDALASACELANARASKVLAVRSEQHAELLISEFVEIFKESWEFVLTSERLANRMIVSLRGVTASQARAFLVRYHSIRLTKSAKLVEEEQWTQVDVGSAVQHTVNILIQSAVSDPAECFIPPKEALPNGTSPESAKVLSVEDKTFHIVKATAESFVLLSDYLKIVINLELVVTDVMSRVIEFLKSFNSRTCQVVLGAGAMRSAGLKNITAKHLALASQSLSIVISLIPYIREFIRRHLSTKQAVMLTEFDKLKRDYQEHQNEIHAKLVAIMSDRLAVHCGALRDIDWEASPDKEGPNAYAELLVKETATLHKVLSKYLAQSTVEGVMSEVLSAIVSRFSEEYTKIEIKSDAAKQRILTDATLIVSRLSALTQKTSDLTSLESLVKAKSLPRKPVGQAMRGLINRVNSGGAPRDLSREGSPVDTKMEPSKLANVETPSVERKSNDSDDLVASPADTVGPSLDAKESNLEQTKPTEPMEPDKPVEPVENGTVAVGEVAKEDEGPMVVTSPALPMINGTEADEVVPGSGVPKIDTTTAEPIIPQGSTDKSPEPESNITTTAVLKPTADAGEGEAPQVPEKSEKPEQAEQVNGTASSVVEASQAAALEVEEGRADKADEDVAPPLPPEKE